MVDQLSAIILSGAVAFLALMISLAFLFIKSTVHEPHKVSKEIKKHFIREAPIPRREVLTHNSCNDAWIIVDGKVYDITDYVDQHPGGDSILNHVGGDASAGFHGPQHPVTALDVLANHYIGVLRAEE
mmetsp:Transcript_28328/g.28620  ORF Transcript_28328/g.28620 Transcript_28328/m.28620 type:complete len:128 (-) Transcript_28328:221-604(-)